MPMSTYLVALVVADFQCKYKIANAGINGTVNVSVCGRADEYKNFDFALETFTKYLENYETGLGIKFPISKCGNLKNIFFFCFFETSNGTSRFISAFEVSTAFTFNNYEIYFYLIY